MDQASLVMIGILAIVGVFMYLVSEKEKENKGIVKQKTKVRKKESELERNAKGAVGGIFMLLFAIGVCVMCWKIMVAFDYDPGTTRYTPPTNDNPGYHGVDSNNDGTDDYIRSNPDDTTTNNINQ